MFYVETSENKITAKGEGQYKTEEQMEVSKDIYVALVNLPADYVMKDGEIVSVIPAPIPQPSPPEKREQAYVSMPVITWEGAQITVDEANTIFLRYFAEDSPKAMQIQALIVGAKETIRQMYPDVEE